MESPAKPSAIVIGGTGSALSVTRSLGRAGVRVYVLGSGKDSLAGSSRYCHSLVDVGESEPAAEGWLSWLLEEGDPGAVLLPVGDPGVELVVRNEGRLRERGYRPLDYAGETSLAMLDKARTYELAREAGVACPRIWRIAREADLHDLGDELPFPCALKPVHSHEFAKHFGATKVLIARDEDELAAALERTLALELEMLVTEIIPGPDHLCWAYRTYIDENGDPLFGLTTNRLRSQPIHFGTNCYLATRWDREVAEVGLQFMRGVGIRGLAYVELKRDPRDGRLKLIECNHRFGNAQEVVRRAGIDAALLAYKRALGEPTPAANRWREGVHLWFPARDLRVARDYRREGELSWPRWLRSLARPRVYTPYLALDDLRPSAVHLWRKLARRVRPKGAAA